MQLCVCSGMPREDLLQAICDQFGFEPNVGLRLGFTSPVTGAAMALSHAWPDGTEFNVNVHLPYPRKTHTMLSTLPDASRRTFALLRFHIVMH